MRNRFSLRCAHYVRWTVHITICGLKLPISKRKQTINYHKNEQIEFCTVEHLFIVHYILPSRLLFTYTFLHVFDVPKIQCESSNVNHCGKKIRALRIHLTCSIILNNIMTTWYNSKFGVEVQFSKSTPISVWLRRHLRILEFMTAKSAENSGGILGSGLT